MDNNTLNPFLSVWLHPKQTARYMIDHKTMGFAMIILTICSIIALPINFFDYGGPLSWGFIIATIIFSPIVTIVVMFISALIAWGVESFSKVSQHTRKCIEQRALPRFLQQCLDQFILFGLLYHQIFC